MFLREERDAFGDSPVESVRGVLSPSASPLP